MAKFDRKNLVAFVNTTTVVESWVGSSAPVSSGVLSIMTKTGANRFLAGCGFAAARVESIGETKVTISYLNGKYRQTLDVPSYMLGRNFLNSMWGVSRKEGKFITSVEVVKYVISSVQEDLAAFKVRLGHLARNETLLISHDEKTQVWRGVASPELYGAQLFADSIRNSVFAIEKDGEIVSSCATTKLIARHHSITHNIPVFTVNNKKVTVILSGGNLELRKVLASGALFVKQDWVETYGVTRIVSQGLGLKAVTAVADVDFLGQFPHEFDAIASKGCVKAGLHGVYKALTGCTNEELFSVSPEEMAEVVKLASYRINTKWGKLVCVDVVEDINVTNPYTLYGYKYVGEEAEEGSSSFNLETVRLFQEGAIKSIPAWIQANLVAELIEEKRDLTQIKFSEIQGVAIHYGLDVARDFMDSLTPSNKLAGHFAKIGEGFTEDESEEIIRTMFVDYSGSISMGQMSSLNFKSVEAYYAALEFALNGGVLASGRIFEGWASKKDVVLTLGGQKFFFPGAGNNAGEFMPKEGKDYEAGVNFGPVMAEVVSLMVALRNPKTNWVQKQLRTQAALANNSLKEEFNSFNVRGKYMVAMPCTWENKKGEIHTTRETMRGKMIYSKMPSLFYAATCGVYVSDIPEELFCLSSLARFAMRCSAYVSVDQLMLQGNDTDGDTIRLTESTYALPKYNGQKVAQKYWDNYVAGEVEMNFFAKLPKVLTYKAEELDAGMATAKINKANVGLYTAELFTVQHILDVLLSNKGISTEGAMFVKEVYALTMQDEAVRAIKHESGVSVWGQISLNEMLQSKEDVTEVVAKAIVEVAEDKLGEVLTQKDAMTFVVAASAIIRGSNRQAWGNANMQSDFEGGRVEKDAYLNTVGNNFSIHGLFVRQTWNKLVIRNRQARNVWGFISNNPNALKAYRVWNMRLGVQAGLIKLFNVNKDNSLAERAYFRAFELFGGKGTHEPEFANAEVVAEAKAAQMAEADSIIQDNEILEFFEKPASQESVQEVVEVEEIVETPKSPTEGIIKVDILSSNEGVVRMSSGKHSKEITFEATGDVNLDAVTAIGLAVEAIKTPKDILVIGAPHNVVNNIHKFVPKWIEGGVGKTVKGRDHWVKVVEYANFADVFVG